MATWNCSLRRESANKRLAKSLVEACVRQKRKKMNFQHHARRLFSATACFLRFRARLPLRMFASVEIEEGSR